jgi:hypothetical protein
MIKFKHVGAYKSVHKAKLREFKRHTGANDLTEVAVVEARARAYKSVLNAKYQR